MKTRFTLTMVCAVMLGICGYCQIPIAYYDFESNTNRSTFENQVEQQVTNVNSSAFSKSAIGTMGNQSGAGTANGGSATGRSLMTYRGSTSSSTDPKTAADHYLQFSFSTAGFSGIRLEFDVYANSASSEDYGILYSTDGTNWNWIASSTNQGTNYLPFPYFLGGYWDYAYVNLPAAADDKSNVYIRIYGFWSGGSSSSYHLRFDNMTVLANSTVAGKIFTTLDEESIYAASLSGNYTGNVWTRSGFTVNGSGTEVTFGGRYVAFTGDVQVNSGTKLAFGTAAQPVTVLPVYQTVLGIPVDIYSTNFTVSSGATLKLTSTDGITAPTNVYGATQYGNIQNFGTRSFSSGASYEYMGSAAQSTGTALPATLTGKLTVSNAAGVTLSGNVTVGSQLVLNSGTLKISDKTLTLNGTITGSGTLSGTSSSNLTIGGSSGSAGTIRFAPGAQVLNKLTMNRTGVTGAAAVLGSSLSANSFAFTNGILATDNNLLTWNNSGGTLTAPNIPWSSGSTAFKNSYVCLCTVTGNELTFTEPYTGTVGFKVKNVGSADTWFPIGVDFTAPNRMVINNANGTAQDFSVVIKKESFSGTALPSVKRTWYVYNSGTNAKASMKLFYTRQNGSNYPASQDEVENGFNYSDGHLVQKTYSTSTPANTFVTNSQNASSDIPAFIGATVGTEIYAAYTYGISKDLNNLTNGIKQFTRFSVTNANGIILPVTMVNLKAVYDNDRVRISFTSLNELNVDRYIIERSVSANAFSSVGSVNAGSVASYSKEYSFIDMYPASGNNFYRIKCVDKNGSATYSNIVEVANVNGKYTITIVPNIVSDFSTALQFENMPAALYSVAVYNSAGKNVYTKQLRHAGGTTRYTLTLPASLTAGTYFVQIDGGDKRIQQKIVIQ